MTYDHLKGFAMPPTPFLGSRASLQGPGPLPMASSRPAIWISLIESFWRAIGAEIDPFSGFLAFLLSSHGYKVSFMSLECHPDSLDPIVYISNTVRRDPGRL